MNHDYLNILHVILDVTLISVEIFETYTYHYKAFFLFRIFGNLSGRAYYD